MLPEERLLQLIRKDTIIKTKNLFKRSYFVRQVLKILSRVKSRLDSFGFFRIALFSYILACAVVFVVFIYNPFTLDKRISKKTQEIEILPNGFSNELDKSLQFYLSSAQENNIFNLRIANQLTSGGLDNAIEDITLLGILAEDPPQAIIQNKKTNQTVFLKENEALGQMHINQILQGKIIVEYRGELYEIHL